MESHILPNNKLEVELEELKLQNSILKSKLEEYANSAKGNDGIEFENFFNLALDLLCIADTEGNFIKVNKAWESILGYPAKELEKSKFLDFVHPNDIETTLNSMSKLYSQQSVISFVNRYRSKSGEWRHIEWFSYPLGKIIYAAARDITERIKYEEALLASEDRFSLVIDSPELGLWDWKLATNEVYYSPQWKKQVGYEDFELKNEFKTWEDLLHPHDFERMHKEIADYLANPVEPFIAEFRMRHKNGNFVWIHNKASTKKDEKGHVVRFFGAHTNITEQKLAEFQVKKKTKQIETQNEEYRKLNEELTIAKETIEQSESKYKKLVENAFDGVYLLKGKNFIYLNPRFIEITGYTAQELSTESFEYNKLLTEHSKKIVEEVYQTRLKGHAKALKYEVQIITKNNEIRDVELTTVPVGQKGEILIMGIMRDITLRRKIERELVQRTHLQALLMNLAARFINIPYHEINKELDNALAEIGEFSGVDRAYIFSYNWASNSMSNTHEWCSEGVSREIDNLQNLPNSLVPAWVEAHKKGKPIHIPSVSLLPPNDTVKEILELQGVKSLITIPMMHNTKCIGYVGFDAVKQIKEWGDAEVSLLKLFAELLINVQVKANYEQSLKEAMTLAELRQTEIKNIIDYSPMGIAHISTTGEIMEINQSAISMLGAPSVDTLKKLNIFKVVPLQKYGFSDDLKNCIETKSLVSKKSTYVSLWGKSLYVKYYLVPIVVEGKVQSVIANVEDISSIKESELKLIALKEKAEESDRLKSAFLANMSHEIRTPMNAICGFSNLLLDDSVESEQRKDFVEVININSQQLLGIINDIIDISKIEAGQISLSKGKFSINNIIKELKTVFEQTAKIKKLNFYYSFGLSDQESIIFSDEMKIRQILNNIIYNAIKFTEIGCIEIGYKVKNNFIEFYVKDTGIGIPPNMNKVVFERFQQVDNSTNQSRKGTGLGLPISKAFVEMLGGKIWFISEFGKGSTFFFTIPYIKAIPKKEANQVNPEIQFAWNNKTILIAEDDNHSYLYLEHLLKPTQARIVRAINGQDAIDICTSGGIDLVLMDLKMPVKSGIEATKVLRSNGLKIPIIAQTAYAFSDDKEMAIKCGCDAFIPKPLNQMDLLNMISKLI